ncbi:MAG: DUF255 domain-containing protein [Cytophagaceae bacterium]|nr:DUF255 domain-containing protein [Cytophagaceae bacterium]
MKTFIKILALAVVLSCSKKNTDKTVAKDPATDPVVQTPANTTSNNIITEEETSKADIKWMSYDEAVKQAKKKPKKIFIDVYTDWCGWCKKMDKTTFKDATVAQYMNEKYYAVKLNAESEKTVSYQGKQMTEKQLAANIFKVTGYPSTVYLESSEKIIQPIPGYMDATTLDKILHYIGEDHYKTQTWEQFQMSYKSE